MEAMSCRGSEQREFSIRFCWPRQPLLALQHHRQSARHSQLELIIAPLQPQPHWQTYAPAAAAAAAAAVA